MANPVAYRPNDIWLLVKTEEDSQEWLSHDKLAGRAASLDGWGLRRLAFAGWVGAGAVNVWGFFHGFTLGAAVLARGAEARTHGVRAFCGFIGGHVG
jgi:hypothetical protein